MADASRDENTIPTLLGASSADGKTPVKVYADPDTHRLLVDSTAGVVGPGSSTDNAIARFDGTTGQTIQNSTVFVSDTGLVQLLGTTSSFPALKRSTTNIQVRLADDSGYAPIDAASYKVAGVAGASGTFTTVDLKTVTVVNGIITDIS